MMLKINGKYYPLWSQFIEKKEKWIGGTLKDFGDSMDRSMGYEGGTTIIKDIELVPNGKTSAYFRIIGKDFNCGFDVQHGGISSEGEEGWLTFSGYGGHKFAVKEAEESKNKDICDYCNMTKKELEKQYGRPIAINKFDGYNICDECKKDIESGMKNLSDIKT